MKPSYEAIAKILDGIDRTEDIDVRGWWETSEGAEFGKAKLQEIRDLFDKEGNELAVLGMTKNQIREYARIMFSQGAKAE